eukprot:47613-Pleurochrysis_carterae.AAC.1
MASFASAGSSPSRPHTVIGGFRTSAHGSAHGSARSSSRGSRPTSACMGASFNDAEAEAMGEAEIENALMTLEPWGDEQSTDGDMRDSFARGGQLGRAYGREEVAEAKEAASVLAALAMEERSVLVGGGGGGSGGGAGGGGGGAGGAGGA